MTTAARFLLLLGLAIWIGEVVFFSFVVAPTLFRVLGPAEAGTVTSALFPRYYLLGTAAALAATAAAFVLAWRAETPRWWIAATLVLAIGLGATVWASVVIHPRAQRLRTVAGAAGRAPGDDAEFQRAHRNAVLLNGVSLCAALAGLALAAGGLRE